MTQIQQQEQQEAPAPGVYRHTPDPEYHSWNSGILSKSLVWNMVLDVRRDGTLELCPAKLKYRIENPKKPTPEMIEGSALGCLLLEGESVFSDRFVMASSCEAKLASGKRKGEVCGNPGIGMLDGEWRCGHHGVTEDEGIPDEKERLDHIQMTKVRGWHRSLAQHPIVCQRLYKARAFEMAMVGTLCGRRFKGKVDLIGHDEQGAGVIPDLKRTAYWRPHAFERHMVKSGWHVQQFAYTSLAYQHDEIDENAHPEFIVAGENALFGSGKDAVYPVEVYRMDDRLLTLGGKHLHEIVEVFDWCDERGEWPVALDKPARRTVTVPAWIGNGNEGSDFDEYQ